jgi:hypothetical protein
MPRRWIVVMVAHARRARWCTATRQSARPRRACATRRRRPSDSGLSDGRPCSWFSNSLPLFNFANPSRFPRNQPPTETCPASVIFVIRRDGRQEVPRGRVEAEAAAAVMRLGVATATGSALTSRLAGLWEPLPRHRASDHSDSRS